MDPSDPSGNLGWSGLFSVGDVNGNMLNGILIGLLLPANNAQLAQEPTLRSIVIAPSGTGLWAGSPGTGRATINFGRGYFQATFQLKPFVNGGKN